jgi:hypothetical protein
MEMNPPVIKPTIPWNNLDTICTKCRTTLTALLSTFAANANMAWKTARTELNKETNTPMMETTNEEMALNIGW